MIKVRPAVNAISAANAFRASGVDHRNGNSGGRKKVKFDLATVCFQVDYNMPDDKTIRRRIPVWTEHWHHSRGNMARSLLRSITKTQWFAAAVVILCSIGLVIQLVSAVTRYSRYETIISADYRLPDSYRLPAITVCLPIIVPIVERCDSNSSLSCQQIIVKDIFNNRNNSEYSQSCELHETVGNKMRTDACDSIAAAVETVSVYRRRKCFTYFSDLSPTPTKPLLHSSPSVTSSPSTSPTPSTASTAKFFSIKSAKQVTISVKITGQSADRDALVAVHQSDLIPSAAGLEFLLVAVPKRRYEIGYRLTRIDASGARSINNCQNYGSPDPSSGQSLAGRRDMSHFDCRSRCALARIRIACDGCVSRYASVRRDLVESGQKLCNAGECPLDEVEPVERECDELCPADCVTETYELSTGESATDNAVYTDVLVRRRLAPDLTVTYLPAIGCVQFVGQIGGLVAFWLFGMWAIITIVRFGKYVCELYELYYAD